MLKSAIKSINLHAFLELRFCLQMVLMFFHYIFGNLSFEVSVITVVNVLVSAGPQHWLNGSDSQHSDSYSFSD